MLDKMVIPPKQTSRILLLVYLYLNFSIGVSKVEEVINRNKHISVWISALLFQLNLKDLPEVRGCESGNPA